MLNLLSSELFRLRKRTQSWLLLIINVVLVALIYGGFVIAARVSSGPDAQSMRQDTTFSSFADFGIAMAVGFFASVMLIIVAAGMMGNEYSWNTLRPLVARSRTRASLLLAKILALTIYAVLFVIALVVIVAGFYFIGSTFVGEPTGFSMSILGDGFTYAFRLAFTHLPYLALAFMLATVFRSNAAGIAGALGLMFIEQPVFMLLGMAAKIFEKIERWGISYNTGAIANNIDDPVKMRSVLILLAYTAIFTAISYVVFLRRDVTSG